MGIYCFYSLNQQNQHLKKILLNHKRNKNAYKHSILLTYLSPKQLVYVLALSTLYFVHFCLKS